MKERPIIFSAESVRAILAGRKSQTRRVIKPQPIGFPGGPIPERGTYVFRYAGEHGDELKEIRCPYAVGDRLWVRETWIPDPPQDDSWDYYGFTDGEAYNFSALPKRFKKPAHVIYRASWNGPDLRWRSPIHMPRWASRLTLEVVESWPERLHDITEEGAIAEGCVPYIDPFENIQIISVTQIYAQLWEALNAKRGYPWDANPWVWVITFKVVTL